MITGGAGGIGCAIARQLASDGYLVAVADINDAAATSIAASLTGRGHVAVHLDVADESSVRSAFDSAESAVGPLDVLVHSAGILLSSPDHRMLSFWESGVDRWDRTLAVNARGAFLVTSEFMRRRVVVAADNGRIVLLSSLLAQAPGSKPYADYSASKAAVLGFMRAAARECAPYGITVNAIAPGPVDTPMMRNNLPPGVEASTRSIPLSRHGRPEDVAAAVRYVVSKEASFVTGATFDLNGGQRMQ